FDMEPRRILSPPETRRSDQLRVVSFQAHIEFTFDRPASVRSIAVMPMLPNFFEVITWRFMFAGMFVNKFPNLFEATHDERVIVIAIDIPIQNLLLQRRDVASRSILRPTRSGFAGESPNKLECARLPNSQTPTVVVNEGGPVL